jgi:AcrR family transcriptional regulator
VLRMTSDERRAVILEAAIKLFSERGFRGTTTRALAEAVGVTEPVLYEHFESKRELYEAIVEVKSREGLAQAMALLQPLADAGDDRALFIALGEFVLGRCYTEDRAYTRLLLLAALEDPALGQVFYERQRDSREALAGYVAERIQSGVFREVDPKVAVRAFIGMLSHHGMSRMLYHDEFIRSDIHEIADQMADLFLNGISKDRSESK